MPRKHHIDSTGVILLILCSAIMGGNQVLVKVVNSGLQPVFQAGLRSACAFVPILLFALAKRRRLSIRDGSLGAGILVGIFFATEFLLLFQALDYTTVSRASIFFYTMPFWTALAAHFLIPGEKLTIGKTVGLLLAISGVVIALSSNQSPATDNALVGDLFCLLGSVLWAAIVITTRITRLSRSCPEMQLLYQLAVSTVLLLTIAPFFGDLVREFTPTIGFLFIVQVIVVGCFGFLIWFWLLSIYPASNVASYSFLSPVLGVIFGWLILDEALSLSIIIALCLVSLGVFLVNRAPPEPQPASPSSAMEPLNKS